MFFINVELPSHIHAIHSSHWKSSDRTENMCQVQSEEIITDQPVINGTDLLDDDSRPCNGIQCLLSAFEKAKKEERLTFLTYVPTGFPKLADSVQVLLSLEKSGSDIIEVGIPFSDPIAGQSRSVS